MFRLHVVPLDGDPLDHLLEGDSLTIGRSSSADLEVEDNFLSRRHARLFRQGDRWLVEDLGSHNGTKLNGTPVEAPAPLSAGDVIRLSGSVITVHPASISDTQAPSFEPASEILERSGLSQPEATGSEAWRRMAERLNLLHDVHQALSRPMSLAELLDLILERVFHYLDPEEGTILLQEADGEYRPAASRSKPGLEGGLLCSRSLIREVAEKAMAALVYDVATDARFAGASSILASGICSLVAAPLLDPEGCLGMIALNSRANKRQFREDDRDLLVSLASIAALTIRNLSLAEEAAERQRLQKELALAREIQGALLPKRLPEPPGYEIHGGNVPSRGVSGDFYLVADRLDGREWVLMVVDVSGKGMAASLLTACLEALSAGPIKEGLPPEQICDRISEMLHQRTAPERFATAFLAVLEPHSGSIRFANAGHNPALAVRASGEVDLLEATGTPLGLVPEAEYAAGETSLAPGDFLLLYTDGIVEAANRAEEEYGLRRLQQVCRTHRRSTAAEIAAAIEKDLEDFIQGVPIADDRTVVLARRLRA